MRSQRNQLKSKFELGDFVTVSQRFFDNHGVKQQILGDGKIVKLNDACTTAHLQIKFHPCFFQYASNGYIKILREYERVQSMIHIEIHTVYLVKKVEEKHGGKKAKSVRSSNAPA